MKTLRWIAVIPAGILAVLIGGFVTHFVLATMLMRFDTIEDIYAADRWIAVFTSPFLFTFFGARVAPYPRQTVIALAALIIIVSNITIWWLGMELDRRALRISLQILGALTAILALYKAPLGNKSENA